jgi:serine/threonine protein kinase
VLASLNHPNIAAIYGLEEDRALILELVQGDNPSGPMPVETVLASARQLAEALDHAHERGIAHRDWKPANIKVTPEGRIKVLDFGLVKAMIAAEAPSDSTETIDQTQQGTILGTAGYMRNRPGARPRISAPISGRSASCSTSC